jgi:hypothetical protein
MNPIGCGRGGMDLKGHLIRAHMGRDPGSMEPWPGIDFPLGHGTDLVLCQTRKQAKIRFRQQATCFQSTSASV